MEQREKRQILTGGVMLIALGILILLNSLDIYGFSKSWPILLIVIAIATLAQNVRDAVGWVVGAVGIVFLVVKNWYANIGELTTYAMPVLLIVIGFYMLLRRRKK